MKIPVYQTGRVGGGNTLPGVSRTARKNPGAMAQAELNKAAPLLTAFEAATSFMVQRQKMATNILYNETLLSGERQLRELAYNLENDSDITNVMDRDSKWVRQSEEIRLALFDKLSGNQAAQAKFNAGFKSSELSLRFQLRNAVDTNLQKREIASLKDQTQDIVTVLSDPSKTANDYDERLGVGSPLDQNYKEGIEAGRFSQDAVDAQLSIAKNTIALNAVKNFVGSDINKAEALEELYEIAVDPARGPMSDEFILRTEELGEELQGGEYAFYTLNKVTESQAKSVVEQALINAIDLSEKLERDANNADTKKEAMLELAKKRMFNIEDDDFYLREDVEKVIEIQPLDLEDLFVTTSIPDGQGGLMNAEGIKGEDYKKLVYNFVNDNGGWGKDDGEAARRELYETVHADFTDVSVFDEIKAAINSGFATQADLNRVKGSLTKADFKTLNDRLIALSDKGFAQSVARSKSKFRYDFNIKKQDADGEERGSLTSAQISAHEYVLSGLMDFRNKRIMEDEARQANNQTLLGPLTTTEYIAETDRLFELHNAEYLIALEVEYNKTVEELNRTYETIGFKLLLDVNPITYMTEFKQKMVDEQNTAQAQNMTYEMNNIAIFKDYYMTIGN